MNAEKWALWERKSRAAAAERLRKQMDNTANLTVEMRAEVEAEIRLELVADPS